MLVFNTNAALLTRRRQIELIDSNLDEVRVSLDGSTPETCLQVCSIPALERVVADIAQMIDTKRVLGATSLRLSFSVTGMRQNLPELSGVVGLPARICVEEVYLQRMVLGFDGDGLANPDQTGADGLSMWASILERQPQAEPWRACGRPHRLACITAQGNALPCCIAPFTDASYDSITLSNHLSGGAQAVWAGDAYRQLREHLYSTDQAAACRNCGVAWSL